MANMNDIVANRLGLARIREVQSMGPSEVVFKRMYDSNPSFRQFADSVRGKSPEQAFKENGLDFSGFKAFKW